MILITERVTKRDLVGSKGVISFNMMYFCTFEYFFSYFRLGKEITFAHYGPNRGVK